MVKIIAYVQLWTACVSECSMMRNSLKLYKKINNKAVFFLQRHFAFPKGWLWDLNGNEYIKMGGLHPRKKNISIEEVVNRTGFMILNTTNNERNPDGFIMHKHIQRWTDALCLDHVSLFIEKISSRWWQTLLCHIIPLFVFA